jgi:DNA modification methylase
MDLSSKSRSELLNLCKERGIKGVSGKKKDEIITLLQVDVVNTVAHMGDISYTSPITLSRDIQFRGGHAVTLINELKDESIRVFYLDPPFDSDRNYTLSVDSTIGFKDKWEDGEYESLIRSVIDACYTKLMKDGTLFFHISADCMLLPHTILKTKFKYVSPIFWKRCRSKNNVKHKLGATIDIIFKCSKIATPLFHVVYQDKDAKYLANSFKNKDARGNYALGHLVTEATKSGYKYDFTINGKTFSPIAGWRIPQSELTTLATDDRLHVPKGENAKLYKKIYLHENPGKPCTDLWDDIHSIGQGSEGRKYPTAKPQKLLERILEIASNPGDLVCDPMCGSGTTGAAAAALSRRCIMFDSNPDVIPIMISRFHTTVESTETSDSVV